MIRDLRGVAVTIEVEAPVAEGEVRIEVEAEAEDSARKIKLVAIGNGMWVGKNGSTSTIVYHHILLD